MGGSADKRYNLSFIVENSVALGTPIVAVSLNYRLSAFGFLCGSEALAAGITNNGFRDQRLALRWVNENVAAFGGDPAKVTIWGESSGAESLNAQVLAYNGEQQQQYPPPFSSTYDGKTGLMSDDSFHRVSRPRRWPLPRGRCRIRLRRHLASLRRRLQRHGGHAGRVQPAP